MQPKAYPYIRYSSDGQSDGDSVRRQTDLAKRFCQTHNLDMQPPILDEGVSADGGNNLINGAIAGFIADVRAGKIQTGSYLLFENPDRFSRGSPVAALSLLSELKGRGILLGNTTTGTKDKEGDAWFGDVLMHIQLALANDENEKKRTRVMQGWSTAKSRAITEQKALTKWCPLWLRVVDGKYEVIEERANVIRRIFNETASMHGRTKIVQRLNAEKVPTFQSDIANARVSKSEGWHDSYIFRVLENRAVLGEFQSHVKNKGTKKKAVPVGDPIPDFYPQIIDFDLWQRATAARMGRRGTGGRKTEQHHNLISGLGTCWFCGSKMIFRQKGFKLHNYLTCDSSIRNAGCKHGGYFRYAPVENAILSAMTEALFDENEFKTDDNVKSLELQIAAVDDQIEKIKSRLFLILNDLDIEPDPQTIKTLNTRKAAAESAKQALLDQLVQVRGKGSPLDHIQAVQALIADATGEDHPGRYEARARISQALRNIIDEIVFDDEARSIIVIAGNHTAGFRIDIEDDYSVKYLRRDTVMQLRTQAKGSKMEALIRRVG